MSTFTWLNKQGVKSADDYVVQFTGRFSAEYREDGRVIRLYVEDGGVDAGLREVVVHRPTEMGWQGDPPAVFLSDEERARVLANLADAFEFQGLKLAGAARLYLPENDGRRLQLGKRSNA